MAFRRIDHHGATTFVVEQPLAEGKRMAKTDAAEAVRRGLATTEDVTRILGNLDPTKMLPIIELRPTVLDVEEASMWLGGDRDVFGPGVPLRGIPSRIVAILTADEEEDERRV
jgi:hypothetical protein